MLILFRHKGDKNEVTKFYLDIIIEAFATECIETQNISDIHNDDIVITSNMIDAYRIMKYNKNTKLINWYQGIIPEEISLQNIHHVKNKIGEHVSKLLNVPLKVARLVSIFAIPFFKFGIIKIVLSYLEKTVLNNCAANIFVSNTMHTHYKKKYNYVKNNYFIMPCFNSVIQKDHFNINSKYKNFTFVYVGGLDKWQCFERTTKIFKHIQSIRPDAKLFVYTPSKKAAKDMLNKFGIKNYEVACVDSHLLSDYLQNYKYGFLIREDISINQVSTPTKLGNYLASGIIPIFSDIIGDIKINLKNVSQKVMVSPDLSDEEIAKKIIHFDKNTAFSPQKIYSEFLDIFNVYYNREIYIQKIRSFILDLLK